MVFTSKQVTALMTSIAHEAAEDLLREAIVEAVVIHFQQNSRLRSKPGSWLTARPAWPRVYASALGSNCAG